MAALDALSLLPGRVGGRCVPGRLAEAASRDEAEYHQAGGAQLCHSAPTNAYMEGHAYSQKKRNHRTQLPGASEKMGSRSGPRNPKQSGKSFPSIQVCLEEFLHTRGRIPASSVNKNTRAVDCVIGVSSVCSVYISAVVIKCRNPRNMPQP